LLVCCVAVGRLFASNEKLNVLFIAIDDLRPELGCYGSSHIKSPNIDKLAARGMVFSRAYCQQAICGPSRASVLTGRRPDTTKVWVNNTHFRQALPDVVTLPQHFKNNGYITQSLGKLMHHIQKDEVSFSEGQWYPSPEMGSIWLDEDNIQLRKELFEKAKASGDLKKAMLSKRSRPTWIKGPPTEGADVLDNAYPDGQITDKAIAVLNEYKDKPKPFFLAVGYLKPHLPFNAPQKYWDLYTREEIDLAPNPFAPKGVPKHAMYSSGEIRSYHGLKGKKDPFSEAVSRELKHGYFACISYVDAQVGQLLAEVDKLGLADKTVIMLWGDHGWHLGEHDIWGKMTNFEIATRAPLIVSYPGQKTSGMQTSALVEFVDMYPTLADLCGIGLSEGLEGTSFVPVLEKPDIEWKEAAFSQYPRGKKIMGYTMRTKRYRYTEWLSLKNRRVVGVELYDYETDPDETENLAKKPANKALVEKLSKMLKPYYRAP